MKKIFNGIGLFILLNLIVYCMILIISPSSLLSLYGFQPYRVISGSMDPVIKTSDVFIIVKPNGKLESGDIAVFKSYVKKDGEIVEIIVSHYIKEITEVGFTTQDYKTYNSGSSEVDQWFTSEGEVITEIPFENLIGKYKFKIPIIGRISREISLILSSKVMVLLIAADIVSISLLFYLIRLEEEEEKKELITIRYSQPHVKGNKKRRNNR